MGGFFYFYSKKRVEYIDKDIIIRYDIIKYNIWEVLEMKKIINGKKYDTETAQLIGGAGYSERRDLYYWREVLYRKKTGEFFLYGEGGPNSKYSRKIGQCTWSGGEQIIPLTLDEAQEWAEKYLDAEKYEEVFGRIEEGKTQIALWIPDSVKENADILREKGYTLADIFEAGVKHLIE